MSLIKSMFGKPMFLGSLIVAALLVPRVAVGQATRTWVSGVGDDANPCSRTAPCKTFAGAISKTAAGGEIDVLDPGGFGAVTITKSISIEAEGVIAGVLVSGTNGIVVAAGVNDNVVLRGLTIEGLGSGLAGVKFISGNSLHIENCTINNFTANGIDFDPSGISFLTVKDTTIRNSINAALPGGGVLVRVNGGGQANASFLNVRSEGNLFGFRVEAGARASAKSCLASMSQNSGFVVFAPSGIAALDLDSCVAFGNGRSLTPGSAGITTNGPQATVRMGNTISTNNLNGLGMGGGFILSYGNNSITGNNVADGTPTGIIALH
jgi:hypothetical protein